MNVAWLLFTVLLGPPSLPPPPPPPRTPSIADPSAPTPLAQARAFARAGDHASAATAYFAAMSDPSPDVASDARFGLARMLYQLEFRASAKALLLEIADPAATGRHRVAALPWLAAVSRELEGDDDLQRALAKYDDAALLDERFDDVRDELYYAMGRAHYEAGDVERSLGLLAEVPEDSDFYVPAQYFTGVAHTRLWQGQAAVDAFKNVLRRQIELREGLGGKRLRRIRRFSRRRDALRARRRPSPRAMARLQRRMGRRGLTHHHLDQVAETERYQQLATLSMGYVFYQANQLDLALKYFDRLPQDSPYWLDGVFAAAWAEFLLAVDDDSNANRHYQRTLGHIHTLRAPFFPYRLYPEAPLLEALTYYYNCRYGSASLALDDFDRRYRKVRGDLDDVLAQYPEDFALLELYEQVHDQAAPEVTRVVVASEDPDAYTPALVLAGLLDDRQLHRRYDVVQRYVGERDRLEADDTLRRSGGLYERLAEDIELEVSAAREQMGAAVRQRLQSASAQIRRFEADALKIRYEILPKSVEQPAEPHDRQRIRVSDGYERYHYNGEYWRDELANYHYEVTSLCR